MLPCEDDDDDDGNGSASDGAIASAWYIDGGAEADGGDSKADSNDGGGADVIQLMHSTIVNRMDVNWYIISQRNENNQQQFMFGIISSFTFA